MEIRSAEDAARISGTRMRWQGLVRVLLDNDDPFDNILGRTMERSLRHPANLDVNELSLDVSGDAYARVRLADAKLDWLARKHAWRPDVI